METLRLRLVHTAGEKASRTRRVRPVDNQEGTVVLDGTAPVWTEPI